MLRNHLRLYYFAKFLIPRRLQIALRRRLIRLQRAKYADIWPIHEGTAAPPEGWTGWPEGKQFAFVLTHDVESERGLDRVLRVADLEESLGFRSSFNFVVEDYEVPASLRRELIERGFEVGVHGLTHDGSLYHSRESFRQHAVRINRVLREWGAVGFRSPSMHHNLEWLHDLDIAYDSSTFDTDPFEPQPDSLHSIFPVLLRDSARGRGYVELPYTLPQDFTLFVLLEEKSIDIWRRKLHWIAERGGLGLVNTHPDYLWFGRGKPALDEYPVERYRSLLEHVRDDYAGRFWHVLPRDLAGFWADGAVPTGRGAVDLGLPERARPLKILMLTESHFPADIRVRQEAFKLREHGHKVSVICLGELGEKPSESLQGVEVYRIPKIELFGKGKQPSSDPSRPLQRVKTLVQAVTGYAFEYLYFTVAAWLVSLSVYTRDRFDVVHTHNPPDTLFLIARFYKAFGKKFVYDHHDLSPDLLREKYGTGLAPVYRMLLLLERFSCRSADRVIATNESYKRVEMERCGVDPDKIFVVRNGPDLREFCPAKPIQPLRDQARTILCYLGAINVQDGLDFALEAFGKVVHDLHYGDIRLLVIGDGDYLYRIRELTREMGLSDHVTFTGNIADRRLLVRYLCTADIFVDAAPRSFLNDRSTFIKHMEYMAVGRPIVSFALMESMDSVGDAGVFIEPNDTTAMAKAIVDLALDERRRMELGAAGRDRVRALCWEKVSKPLVRMYADLAGSGGNHGPHVIRSFPPGSRVQAETRRHHTQSGGVH